MTDTESLPQLGPFLLGEQIGKGGMGAVYRGRHRETGIGVAIKVIRGDIDGDVRERFRREVQAHAGLLHPSIVYLFEYGTVGEQAAEASGGELVEGSPYVATELAGRGTVRDHLPVGRWRSVRRMILQVLDGLAFSHAREVVHRDLKPENFLVFEAEGPGETQIKLADFGIAHAIETSRQRETDSLSQLSGTPHYMAPEQAEGRWREFGPWTDLYALGCVVWEIVCGRPPFQGDRAVSIILEHVQAERPPLVPQFPVPEGLEGWLRRMMAIEPRARFQRAADAARMLPASEQLERPARSGGDSADGQSRRTDVVESGRADLVATVTLGETIEQTVPEGMAPTLVEESSIGESGDGSRGRPRPKDRAGDLPGEVVTEDWRAEERGELPRLLIGTGLGLFGLREVPFVDRDAERDRLWKALRLVERTDQTRLVVVAGESGAGKSRLVDWVATRAHELGAASVFRAVHTPGGEGPAEGLPGMVRRMCRAWKFDRDELYDHLLEKLPALDAKDSFREVDARALTELLEPTDATTESVVGPRYRFSNPGQKFELLARLVARYGHERPPIVWLDDVQWGSQAVGWVEHLFEEARALPRALVVVSVRSENLADQPALAERLDALVDAQQGARIEVDALPFGEHRQMIERMLPLESDFAEQVARRTEGNPLFAAQLLGEWIERSELEVGPQGFRLEEERSFGVPEDIHELWMARLERLIGELAAERAETLWRAIEMAAALGREVDAREWRGLVEMVGLEMADELETGLVDRGLAERTRDGWAFAHGMLVESLEQEARVNGRWQGHHRRCLQLLEKLYPEHPSRTAVRRAEHLIEAGELEAALGPLLEEAERLHRRGDPLARRRVLRRRQRLMERLEIPPTALRVVQNNVEMAAAEIKLAGSATDLRDTIEAQIEYAERLEKPRLISRACQVATLYFQKSGELVVARKWGERALEAARQTEDERAKIRSHGTLGWTQFTSGNFQAGHHHLSQAHQRAARTGRGHLELKARGKLAWVMMVEGQAQEAKALFQEVARETRQRGYRALEAQSMNSLGEIARLEGDVEEARRMYERFGTLYEELNDAENRVIARLNQAYVDVLARDFGAALERFEEVEARLEEYALGEHIRRNVAFGRLAVAAGRGEWAEFDRRLARMIDSHESWEVADKDYQWLLEIAGEDAEEAGERRRAERAWRLARRLWAKLENRQAVERLDQRLD